LPWQIILSQTDTIYPRSAARFAADIKEIAEDKITYGRKNSTLTFTILTSEVSKIRFKNGSFEFLEGSKEQTSISKSKANEENPAKKTALDAGTKAKIEALAIESGKKISHCAISDIDNLATFVDWEITQRNVFKPDLILIYIKVLYEKHDRSERDWYKVKLVLNESNNNLTWALLSASDKGDAQNLLHCQKRRE
jgi:hypothetical protein